MLAKETAQLRLAGHKTGSFLFQETGITIARGEPYAERAHVTHFDHEKIEGSLVCGSWIMMSSQRTLCLVLLLGIACMYTDAAKKNRKQSNDVAAQPEEQPDPYTGECKLPICHLLIANLRKHIGTRTV